MWLTTLMSLKELAKSPVWSWETTSDNRSDPTRWEIFHDQQWTERWTPTGVHLSVPLQALSLRLGVFHVQHILVARVVIRAEQLGQGVVELCWEGWGIFIFTEEGDEKKLLNNKLGGFIWTRQFRKGGVVSFQLHNRKKDKLDCSGEWQDS